MLYFPLPTQSNKHGMSLTESGHIDHRAPRAIHGGQRRIREGAFRGASVVTWVCA